MLKLNIWHILRTGRVPHFVNRIYIQCQTNRTFRSFNFVRNCNIAECWISNIRTTRTQWMEVVFEKNTNTFLPSTKKKRVRHQHNAYTFPFNTVTHISISNHLFTHTKVYTNEKFNQLCNERRVREMHWDAEHTDTLALNDECILYTYSRSIFRNQVYRASETRCSSRCWPNKRSEEAEHGRFLFVKRLILGLGTMTKIIIIKHVIFMSVEFKFMLIYAIQRKPYKFTHLIGWRLLQEFRFQTWYNIYK